MTKRVRRIQFGLDYPSRGGTGLYAYRKAAQADRFVNEFNIGSDDALFKQSHCITFDGVMYLYFLAMPAGTTINSHGGTATLTIDVANKKITGTAGTAWDIVLHDSLGNVWAELPCAEGAGVTCFDVSGNGNHAYCSSYTSLTSFRGSTQDSFHWNIYKGYSKLWYMPNVTAQHAGVGVDWRTHKELTVVMSCKYITGAISLFNSNGLLSVTTQTPAVINCFGSVGGGAEQNWPQATGLDISASWGKFFILRIKHVSDTQYTISFYSLTSSVTFTINQTLSAFERTTQVAMMMSVGATATTPGSGIVYSAACWKRGLTDAEIDSILNQDDKKFLDFSAISATDKVFTLQSGVFSFTGTLQPGVGAVVKVPGCPTNLDALGLSILSPSGRWHNLSETKLQSTPLGLYTPGSAVANPKFKHVEIGKESRFLVFNSTVPAGKLLTHINTFET